MSRLIYGVRPVQEALKRGGVRTLWLAERREAGARDPFGVLVELARARGIRIEQGSNRQLDQLTGGGSHQGVVALAGEFEYCPVEDLVDPSAGIPLLLAVDGVTDPQNLGAMIRAALVLGCSGVILTKDRCAAITDTVVRVSSGATEHLRCAMVTNLARTLRWLGTQGLWTYGTVESGGAAPRSVALDQPCVLVMGSEQKGVRPLVLKGCDQLITIPAPGPFAALNVAAATAVVFYEATRQRLAIRIGDDTVARNAPRR